MALYLSVSDEMTAAQQPVLYRLTKDVMPVAVHPISTIGSHQVHSHQQMKLQKFVRKEDKPDQT